MPITVIYITASTTKRLEDIVDFNLKLYPLLKCAKENNLGIQTIFVEKPQKSDTKRKPKYCSFVRMMNYLKEHQEIECFLISGFEGITRDYEKITEIYDLHKMLYIVYGNNHSTLSHAMDSGEVLKKQRSMFRILINKLIAKVFKSYRIELCN